MKLKDVVLLVITFSMQIMVSYSTPVVITDIYDSPDPLPYNQGNITVTAVVNRIDSPETDVLLQILSPEEVNVSYYKKEFIDSQRNKYYFTFDPSLIGTYSYRIYAVNDNNETTISETKTFESATFPYFEAIVYDSKVKWDYGNITFNITMRKWEQNNISYNVSHVIVMILSPEVVNITLTKTYEVGNFSYWYGEFDPKEKSYYIKGSYNPLYKFRVFANDTFGNISISEERTFISETYYPIINKSYIIPGKFISVGVNVSIYLAVYDETNHTNKSSNINLTEIYLLEPDLSLRIENMTKINETHYVYNFTPTKEGDYFYKIYIYDEEGNIAESQYYGLSTSPATYDVINISVKIKPSCQARIFLLPDEDKLLVNTTIIWLSIFENIGNVPLNETTNISIEKDEILPGEEKFVIIPPNIFAYSRDDEEEVDILDDTFFFLIWFTHGLPLGNYTARTYSSFWANVSYEGGYFYCNGTVNDTVKFELVDAIGESRPSPFLVIREMPEQVSQDANCLLDENQCISTKIRLVLFNRGDKVARDIIVKDTINLLSCSYDNTSYCEDIKVKCLNSSSYFCEVTTNKSTETASLQFNITREIGPRDYVILEYLFYPPKSMLVYNDSVYRFNLQGRHKYGDDTTNYVIQENDLRYNKEEYKLLYLRELPSFMFDLTVLSSNTTEKRRSFSVETEEEFLISAEFISDVPTGDWILNVTFPKPFTLKSCSYISGPACSCSIDNITNAAVCYGSQQVNKGDVVEFSIKLQNNINSEYILPTYANDTTYTFDEDFLPGLFVISIPKNEIPLPVPQPVPEPTPQPTPQPEPQPETGPEINQQHLPKVEIVIRPLNESYVVYQGDTFPTYFEIENIGNVTAENITIEAILPSELWDQSKAYIDVLDPGEKVNRTLMFSLDEDVAPGVYVIPVKAMVRDSIADITYITIKVLFAKKLAKLKILETAYEVEIKEGSNLTLPVLIKNIGKKILHNVSVRLENVEECLESFSSTKEKLNLNESKTIYLSMKAKEVKSRQCKVILIAYSDEGAYDFSPLIIKVYPKPALLPLRENLTPMISLLWTMVFILYAVIRKRKAMRGERPKSKVPRLILYLLLLGEIIIIIYIILWIFGLVVLL